MGVSLPLADFNFDSACTTPYVSAPSSPRVLGRYYTSAPTSPTGAAAIYSHFRAHSSSSSVIPFDWEETPGTPKRQYRNEAKEEDDEDLDFAFEFKGKSVVGSDEVVTATADELFEAGKIRPLKPPPRLQAPSFFNQDAGGTIIPSPQLSPSSQFFLSPRRRPKLDDFDPFEKAIEETTRGRDQDPVDSLSSSTTRGSRRAARSLSPLKGIFNISDTSTTITSTKGGGSKKWRLKDFFLFRSASEGRATGNVSKDPLSKYTAALAVEDVKNSSFRSTESGSGSFRTAVARNDDGSVGGSSRRGISPHEMHYKARRAVSQELKRKTLLPYRQGVLGCIGFNPSVEGIAKALGSITGVYRR